MNRNDLNELFGCELDYQPDTSEVYEKLKSRLADEPDYEVWVPFVYHRAEKHILVNVDIKVVTTGDVLLSNRGNLVSLRRDTPIFLATHFSVGGYPSIVIFGLPVRTFQIHRAIASAFIPRPTELKDIPFGSLEVNHIDGDKANLTLTNLEWTTKSGNQLHAVANNLTPSGKESRFTKSVKGTILKGPFAGYEFILHGVKDHQKYGFQQPNISACCAGKVKSHKSCSWEFATNEDLISLPVGLTDEIRDSLV